MEIRSEIRFLFQEIREIAEEAWGMILLVYLLGLVTLTFYARHIGVELAPFWMYSPILPFLMACVIGCFYGSWENWQDGDQKSGDGFLFLVGVFSWPVLIWHLVSDFGVLADHWIGPYLLTTRLWPVWGFAVLVALEIVKKVWLRKSKPKSHAI
jgi:hypothetical protein